MRGDRRLPERPRRPRRVAVGPALAGTVLAVLVVGLLLAACEREQRRFEGPPFVAAAASRPAAGGLAPGPSASTASGPSAALPSATASAVVPLMRVVNADEDNAWAVSQGQRWFQAYNCSGCHGAHGGGGMGPPLTDDKWIYGPGPAQVASTILQGRPNGMPSFAGRINDDQLWQLVAYVRSLSGQLRSDVAPARRDAMAATEDPARHARERARNVSPH